ncbi:MAG TPA: hypothetical protein DCF78_06900, partial [Dehalococcoidia bacterium]|nr:hypothetical protein [Dehalococcoidia bacterium]
TITRMTILSGLAIVTEESTSARLWGRLYCLAALRANYRCRVSLHTILMHSPRKSVEFDGKNQRQQSSV